MLIVLGLVIIVYPGITLLLFVEILGAFLIIAGVTEIAFGLSGHESGTLKGLFVVQGIFSIIIGFLAILLPGMTLLLATYLVAAGPSYGDYGDRGRTDGTRLYGRLPYGTSVKMSKGIGF